MRLLRQIIKEPNWVRKTTAEFNPISKEFGHPTKDTYDEIVALMKEARIFVVAPFQKNKAVDENVVSLLEGDMPISLPFKTCWFEMAREGGGEQPMLFYSPPNSEMSFASLGAMLNEVSPGVYDAIVIEAVTANKAPEDPVKMTITVWRGVGADWYIEGDKNFGEDHPFKTIQMWLGLVNGGLIAIEETDEVILVPRADRPSKKKPHRISHIVRVMPRKVAKASVLPITQGGRIDWTHRWEVRGHWRRIEGGIGKDREGIYSVGGFTWVKEHARGPEDKLLIKKTRLIKGGDECG